MCTLLLFVLQLWCDELFLLINLLIILSNSKMRSFIAGTSFRLAPCSKPVAFNRSQDGVSYVRS